MEPAVAGPIVKPLIVTVNAADVLMVAPDVLSTTELLPVAPHTMSKPGTLLAPTATTGNEAMWDTSTQEAMIATNLVVSGHGSPNKEFPEVREQVCFPLHMFSTI